MADSSQLNIPDATRAKFGDLITAIIESQSMNDEERQYWINILPIMTPEQVTNLQEILTNEKKQLQAIDEKYSIGAAQVQANNSVQKTAADRKSRRTDLESKEQAVEGEEAEVLEDVLQQIEDL